MGGEEVSEGRSDFLGQLSVVQRQHLHHKRWREAAPTTHSLGSSQVQPNILTKLK